ncbi:ubiquitin C-terminal hydrolase [Melampsora larici-populina 98AG31]|uniref:Ubiquitin carboxyl-terminal hydrolase n=1 Tax=Melampsora larici-populina (strain 98AG31 / pathotype 3-4-7) TaxID=747676 RepID=F4S107_MELLP|nr:ubiquitin C-terminal hydrolase [Melampsora larici-populina 98AG31]EGG01722.1 ubiquitin C-terminal hydrolase [Melampsora larici-populina 98AG31]
MAFSVSIKHAGKKYDLDLDINQPPSAFKQSVYRLTGVEPSKQKILVKGGQLKDDSDWSKLGVKPGHQFMVIGTAGELPKAPSQPIVFMEDMTDTQLAEVITFPAGLENMGNTCYLNSTVQVLRAIPELQANLNEFKGSSSDALRKDSALTSSLRDTYKDLCKTTDSYSPFDLIRTLRSFAPQFAQQTQGHFAQQDAEECWGQIIGAVRSTLDTSDGIDGKFVDRFMAGEMTTETKCIEAPDEPPTIQKEKWLELKCNISISTNYLITGIQDGLQQPLQKDSPSLGRSAQYMQSSKISRLPSYLTVHMVRFFWRRDIAKKTKIMRKVKFPFNLDLTDLLTDDLKAKVGPVASKIKDVEKDRRERIKTKKKRKIAKEEAAKETQSASLESTTAPATGEASASSKAAQSSEMDVDEDEGTLRETERALLHSLVDPDLIKDVGSNVTGQYELCGIVTHKGISADGGHYLAWVRCDSAKANPNLNQASSSQASPEEFEDPDQQEWYKFDDDKVSVVKRDKITTLDGGGEDSTAYLLLYRSVAF